MSTFITRLDTAGPGPRLAVKDLIDVKGVTTTAGSRSVERSAAPATSDAACLAGARAAGARIVGKTNLHELAMLPLGTNQWFGTPANPLDPALIPGGSSSGSGNRSPRRMQLIWNAPRLSAGSSMPRNFRPTKRHGRLSCLRSSASRGTAMFRCSPGSGNSGRTRGRTTPRT